MEWISTLIGTLCISSFIMGILINFGKFESTQKVIRFVVSLFIVVTIFKPYSENDFSFDFDFSDISIENPDISSSIINNMVIEKTKENLIELVKNRLKQKNISYIDLNVHILDQDGNLIIDKITIIGCDETQKEEINSCLSDLISRETKIVLGE